MLIKADRHHQAQEEEMVNIVQCGEHHHCFYGATCNVFSGRHDNVSVSVVTLMVLLHVSDVSFFRKLEKLTSPIYNVTAVYEKKLFCCDDVIG